MKTTLRTAIALIFSVASLAYAAVPPVNVTVSDASGKLAYKGATDAKGAFATGKLQKGNYVVQFNSKNASVKGNNYALFISAGKKKVTAASVAGEKFTAGGVAMKIDVSEGLNITGQITTGLQTMVDKNGKTLVWIPQRTGSNLSGHWAPEDSAEAKEVIASKSFSTKNIQDIQAHQDQRQ